MTTEKTTGRKVATDNTLLLETLSCLNTNVMVANNDREIIYINKNLEVLLKDKEREIKQQLPNFDASNLLNTSVDRFHKDPEYQKDIISNMKETFNTELELGGVVFGLIANPIFDSKGKRLGTSVEWEDLTDKKLFEQHAKDAMRVRIALDSAQANVMIADNDRNIVYINSSLEKMLKEKEREVQQDVPNFRADDLVGTCVDVFHKNPNHQKSIINGLEDHLSTRLVLGGITFGLIATPIFDENGDRLGTSVEWSDMTQQLLFEEQAKAAVQIKTALDGATTNMMLADENNRINYVNRSVLEMLKSNEKKIRESLPNFNADTLIGTSIDEFHANPAHQQRMVAQLDDTYETRIQVSGLQFDLVANPIIDEKGERTGTSVEWRDVTQEVNAQTQIEELISAAGEGQIERRLDTSNFSGFMQTIAQGLNDLLQAVSEPINEIIGVTRALAANDLSTSVDKDFKGSFGMLKDSINEACGSINDVLRQTNSVVGQVTSSVSQLRVSSQEISTGAQEQSAAVEEVSANLSQTDSQVKANAQNANVANQLASETASSAEFGQNKMQDMITAMNSISDSSEDISKIIKVIDDIAFQTNLLALNAAVEAARAGHHGKGFAVVAQEVRNLAGRSAKAAKETADLIEDSTRRVKQGVSIADSTAQVLGDIVNNVLKVKDLVAEIAAASDEQTKGITQVNIAMTQVSTAATTSSQQSLELASASDQLASLTEQLSAEVARFKLREEIAAGGLNGLPENISPEVLQQIMGLLQKQGAAIAPAAAASAAGNASPSNSGNGVDVPPEIVGEQAKRILPLDSDERGYGKF